ncbi:hypothetical protein ACQ86F_31675 [Streptomyces venezuelae ATCC 10712]
MSNYDDMTNADELAARPGAPAICYMPCNRSDRAAEDADCEWAGGWTGGLGQAVAYLALPYTDHPDCQVTWRL